MNKQANTQRGEVSLKLAGEGYKLIPSYENLAKLEDGSGPSILDLATRLQKRAITIDELAKIISCTAEPDIEREAAGRALVDQGIVQIIEPVSKLLANALMGGREGNVGAAKEK